MARFFFFYNITTACAVGRWEMWKSYKRREYQAFEAGEDNPPTITKAVKKLGGVTEPESSTQSNIPLVTMGGGLPALPKKVVLPNEYIDSAELPPARGPVPHGLEG